MLAYFKQLGEGMAILDIKRHLHRFTCCPNFIRECLTFVEPLTPRCISELLLTKFCIIIIQDTTDCAILTDQS